MIWPFLGGVLFLAALGLQTRLIARAHTPRDTAQVAAITFLVTLLQMTMIRAVVAEPANLLPFALGTSLGASAATLVDRIW